MNSINNKTLLTEIQRLDYETTTSKIHAIKCSVQVYVLSRAFAVKNYEDEKPKDQFENYERFQVQTNDEIKMKFTKDIEDYQDFSINKNLLHLQEYTYYKIIFTLEIVEFFNKPLAEELKELAKDKEIHDFRNQKTF